MRLPWAAIQSATSARALAAARSVAAARMWRSQRNPCSALSQPRFPTSIVNGERPAVSTMMAAERKAAVIDFDRNLRIGKAQVRRSDQHALRRAAGIAPAIEAVPYAGDGVPGASIPLATSAQRRLPSAVAAPKTYPPVTAKACR